MTAPALRTTGLRNLRSVDTEDGQPKTRRRHLAAKADISTSSQSSDDKTTGETPRQLVCYIYFTLIFMLLLVFAEKSEGFFLYQCIKVYVCVGRKGVDAHTMYTDTLKPVEAYIHTSKNHLIDVCLI